MALTRLYLPLDEAAAVSPTISTTDWSSTHINAVRRRLLQTPDSSTLTDVQFDPDAAQHISDINSHHRQGVTDPIPAQTISGNFKAQLIGASGTQNFQFLTFKIYVVSNDGSTVRGVLLPITRDDIALVSTSRNRSFSAALTPVDAEENDRVVVEFGLGGLPVDTPGTQTHNGNIRWGCSALSGDLPEEDDTLSTTHRGWIEFSELSTVAEDEYVSVCVIT